MMRRFDLLPAAYLSAKRERRAIGYTAIAGLTLLFALIGWWVWLGMRVSDARGELAAAQQRNADLQAQINELQQYADIKAEVDTKQATLARIMAGDADWPGLLTDIALVVPNDVWFTSLTASVGAGEGATQVGTETASIRLSPETPFGRIQFQGGATSMDAVAQWLTRLRTVSDFGAIWLESATKQSGEEGASGSVTYSNTVEVNSKAASNRYQEAGEAGQTGQTGQAGASGGSE